VTIAAAAAAAIPVALPVNRSESPANSDEEQVLSSNSSPGPHTAPSTSGSGGAGDLTEENERLRKENVKLSRELGQMKKMCGNIMVLMSKYAAGQSQSGGGDPVGEAVEAPVLDLMPGGPGMVVDEKDEEPDKMEEVNSTKIFGFSLGLKRSREEESDGSGPSTGDDVKMEPLDQQDPKDLTEGDDQRPWPIYRPRPVYQVFKACSGLGSGSDQRSSDLDGSGPSGLS
jgi:heat shock transcription factor, other eukaryote